MSKFTNYTIGILKTYAERGTMAKQRVGGEKYGKE